MGDQGSEFGGLLRGYRLAGGMTQEQLAEKSGLSVRTIRNLERGLIASPRAQSAQLLADALDLAGIDRAQLLQSGRRTPELGAVVPRQLPAAMRQFVGRRAQLAELGDASGHSPVLVLSGTAGVGKTTLAVHWAGQVTERFPDGQLYVNLRGFDPAGGEPVSAAEALHGFLDGLGVPATRVPAELSARVGLYRSLLAGKQILVLLDNARDAEQVRPLLPGGPDCLVLVTSRNQLDSLVAADAAHGITLDLLTPAESRELLAGRLGQGRVNAEPDAVADLIEFCARLPLALSVSAARAVSRPSFPLSALVGQVRGSQPLSALGVGDPATDVRNVISWSYRQLSAAAARVFRLLALHPGPDMSVAVIRCLAGLSVEEFIEVGAELLRANLLTEPAPGRYAYHDLLRAYARERVFAEESVEARHRALTRCLGWYLHTAYAADRALDPLRRAYQPDADYRPAELPEFADHAAALTWFRAERVNLVSAVQAAADSTMDSIACQLPAILLGYYYMCSQWDDWLRTHELCLAAAKRLGDRRAESGALDRLGVAYSDLGRYAESIENHRAALAISQEIGDRHSEAWIRNNMGVAYTHLDRYVDALDCFTPALSVFRDVGDRQGEGLLLNNLGDTYRGLAQLEKAREYLAAALRVQAEDRSGQRYTHFSLGDLYRDMRQYHQAQHHYRAALAISRELGDRRGVARGLTLLAHTFADLGQPGRARSRLTEALEIYEELRDPQADQIRAELTATG